MAGTSRVSRLRGVGDDARLARYCARPAFSAERLDRWDNETRVHRLKRPLASGESSLVLSPVELLSRLAALVPPPRRHGIHYYGVLSAHAKLREKVIESAGPSGVVAIRLREVPRMYGHHSSFTLCFQRHTGDRRAVRARRVSKHIPLHLGDASRENL